MFTEFEGKYGTLVESLRSMVVAEESDCWVTKTTHYSHVLVRPEHGLPAGREYSHRVIMEMKEPGFLQSGLVARHTCDNRRCINPAHLISGTSLDNFRDAAARGRLRSIGTIERANALRADYEKGDCSQYDLADIYGIDQSCVSRIVNYETWLEFPRNSNSD